MEETTTNSPAKTADDDAEDTKMAAKTESETETKVVGDDAPAAAADHEMESSSGDESDNAPLAAAASQPKCNAPRVNLAESSTGIRLTFAQQLMALLEKEDVQPVMHWLADGKSVCIEDPNKFATEVMPKYFCDVKYKSFMVRMKRWGFKMVGNKEASGGLAKVFQCELFRRDQPDLCLLMGDMRRLKKVKDTKKKEKRADNTASLEEKVAADGELLKKMAAATAVASIATTAEGGGTGAVPSANDAEKSTTNGAANAQRPSLAALTEAAFSRVTAANPPTSRASLGGGVPLPDELRYMQHSAALNMAINDIRDRFSMHGGSSVSRFLPDLSATSASARAASLFGGNLSLQRSAAAAGSEPNPIFARDLQAMRAIADRHAGAQSMMASSRNHRAFDNISLVSIEQDIQECSMALAEYQERLMLLHQLREMKMSSGFRERYGSHS
mmetsp:Transcript_15270/g.32984  ORF Transcript_15270/g.32984 Transcript_15270/m.32984 type:complete len:444 (-) Transcript_15270:391-1722(-)